MSDFVLNTVLKIFTNFINLNFASSEVVELEKHLIVNNEDFANEDNNLGYLLFSSFMKNI